MKSYKNVRLHHHHLPGHEDKNLVVDFDVHDTHIEVKSVKHCSEIYFDSDVEDEYDELIETIDPDGITHLVKHIHKHHHDHEHGVIY